MRHKYATQGIVLARYASSEASSFITLLTPDFGMVRAKAQGVRKPGAKLAPALQTLASSDIALVKGREGWRLTGAILNTNWFAHLSPKARSRVGRVAQLLVRLVPEQLHEPLLYQVFTEFLQAMETLSEEEQDAAECIAALRILKALGLDTEEIPEGELFGQELLCAVKDDRSAIVSRINRGIAASGL